MNVKHLQGSVKRTFDFTYFDSEGVEQTEPVTIHVKRVTFRKAVAAEFAEIQKGGDRDTEKLAGFIADQIESWDLAADDHGTPYPLSAETLLDLDQSLIAVIMDEVTAVIFPNPRKAKP